MVSIECTILLYYRTATRATVLPPGFGEGHINPQYCYGQYSSSSPPARTPIDLDYQENFLFPLRFPSGLYICVS